MDASEAVGEGAMLALRAVCARGDPMAASDDAPVEFDQLAEAFVERVRADPNVDVGAEVEAEADRYPSHAEDIRKLFPLLAMVEGAKGEPPSGPGGTTSLPREIDGYTIIRELGRGGMGCVFEASKDGRRVALKVIHAGLVQKSSVVERFLQEARLGAQVSHPGVVRTLGAGTVAAVVPGGPPQPYLVMEFVKGENLRELLDDAGAVSERLAVHIGRCVAGALAAIHLEGIVHRDIKPENVIITPDERVLVMDLGVALVQDEARRLSRTGEFVGSLLYASPEQLRGIPVDGRADLYALGLLLYELTTGVHPSQGKTGATDDAPHPRDLEPGLSHFLDALVHTLIQVDRDRRPASAGDVELALSQGDASAWWRSHARPKQLWSERLGHDAVAERVGFFGREAACHLLDKALEQALRGDGRVVAVRGEAGIGKSRLVRAWLTDAVRDPMQVVVASHAPEGEAFSVPPVARALAEGLGINSLPEQLASLLGPSACLAPAFAKYLRGEEADDHAIGLPATVVTTATVRLACGLSRRQPLILVVEDVHYASDQSQDLCRQVARALRGHPALVLLTFRAPSTDALWETFGRWPHADRLELGPLASEAGLELVRALGGPELRAPQAADLARRADGNPLYVTELVRSVARRIDAPPGTQEGDALPETLRSLLGARLLALSDDERELLGLAACCGHEFDPILVADAHGASRLRTLKDLGRIERRHGLLQQAGGLYRFEHHLVREMLYAELHAALRASFHGAIASALAKPHTVDGADAAVLPGPAAHTLALHALQGNAPEVGLRHVPTALRWLRRRRDAVALVRLATMVLNLGRGVSTQLGYIARFHLADGEVDLKATGDVLLRIAGLVGDMERVPADARLECEARILHAYLLRSRERYEEALAALAKPEAIAKEIADLPLASSIARFQAGVLRQLGRRAESDAAARRALVFAEEGESAWEECSATNSLGIRATERGAYAEARALYERARETAVQCGKRTTECTVTNNLAAIHRILAEPEAALEANAVSLALAQELANPQLEARALLERGRMRACLGRFTEAATDFEAGRRIVEPLGWREEGLEHSAGVSELAAATGRLPEALEHTRRALTTAREAGRLKFERLLLLLCTDVLAGLGRLDEADASFHAARQIIPAGRGWGTRQRAGAVAARLALWHDEPAVAVQGLEVTITETAGHEHRIDRGWLWALLAYAAWRAGSVERARSAAEEARVFSRESGLPGEDVLARCVQVALQLEDAVATRQALESVGASMPWWAQVLAWHALGQASGRPRDVEQARALVAQAQPDLDMRASVPLYRRFAGASPPD